MLFSEFVDDFYWPQKTRLKSTTVINYKRDIRNKLLPAFGNTPIENIDRYHIQKMISACSTRKVATNARQTLSSILSLALEMGLINVNPASFRYEYPPKGERSNDAAGVVLSTFAEIKHVLDYVHDHYPDTPEERMCVMGLCFGLRKGEILGLNVDDIYLDEGYIEIKRTFTPGEGGPELGEPKTPNAFRMIPIMSYARERISSWDMREGALVRSRWDRMPPQTAFKHITKVFQDAKFDDGNPVPRVTLFTMRHSFGTSCVAAGIEISKISKWMGHCDVTTTYNRYVKHQFKDFANEISTMDAAFSGN